MSSSGSSNAIRDILSALLMDERLSEADREFLAGLGAAENLLTERPGAVEILLTIFLKERNLNPEFYARFLPQYTERYLPMLQAEDFIKDLIANISVPRGLTLRPVAPRLEIYKGSLAETAASPPSIPVQDNVGPTLVPTSAGFDIQPKNLYAK